MHKDLHTGEFTAALFVATKFRNSLNAIIKGLVNKLSCCLNVPYCVTLQSKINLMDALMEELIH